MLTITEKKNPTDIPLPLGLYESVEVAEGMAEDQRSFSVVMGLSKDHIAQVKAYALDLSDEALQKNTTDHARFGQGHYDERFAKKERHYFTLIDAATNVVAAIIWFGPRVLPVIDAGSERGEHNFSPDQLWHSIGFRAYGKYRGTGIMRDFTDYVLAAQKKLCPEHRIWLEVNKDIAAAVALYEKTGFKTIGQSDRGLRYVMVLAQ